MNATILTLSPPPTRTSWIDKIKDMLKKLLAKVSKSEQEKNPTPWSIGGTPAHTTPTTDNTCRCDLSGPLVDPPWSGAELARMGNASECPTWRGLDIRLRCTYPKANGGRTWLLGQLLPLAMGQNNGKLICKCFTKDGVAYHFLGYAYNSASMTPLKAGETFDYKTTTFVYYEARKA
jgi:hypothetical protein